MRNLRLLTAVLLAGGLVTGPALARHHHHAASVAMNTQQNVNASNTANLPSAANINTASTNNSGTLAAADQLLHNASGVISNMQSDSNLMNLMSRAKGVFIVPNSASLSSGGVLLTKKNSRWSNPVFFSMGAGAPGAQPTANTGTANVGSANGGPVALLIMSNRAMSRCESSRNFSLTPSTKLNIVNYSAAAPQMPQRSQASPRRTGDIIVWSGANVANTLAPNFTQVSGNALFNQTTYGTANMRQILAGRAPLTNQLAVNLSTALPANQPATQVGTRETTTRPG